MKDQTLEIVKRVLVSHEDAPLEDMERLIGLATGDPVLTRELLEGSVEVLSADPASLVPCWLALIAGELGPASADLLLSALGTSEGEALDATIVSVLARHVRPFYEAITAAIEQAAPEDGHVRVALYSALLAVAVGDDGELRGRLRDFARQRAELEVRMPGSLGVADEAAYLLAASGGGDDGGSVVRDVRLESITELMNEDWRASARRIATAFGPLAARD